MNHQIDAAHACLDELRIRNRADVNGIYAETISEGKEVADHPNKQIREAIRYAEANGWTVVKAGPRAHIWGMNHERARIHLGADRRPE